MWPLFGPYFAMVATPAAIRQRSPATSRPTTCCGGIRRIAGHPNSEVSQKPIGAKYALCSSQPQCDSSLLDGAVRVDLHAQFCNDGSVTCDTNLCLHRIVRCTLPSLPAGDWPLVLPGNQTRLLRVRQQGLSSCQLP